MVCTHSAKRASLKLQSDTIDLNRHDSLLLLRVQNDLNTLGLALRDMSEVQPTSEIAEYRAEFAHLRADLEEAIQEETQLAPVTRAADKQAQLLEFAKTLLADIGTGVRHS